MSFEIVQEIKTAYSLADEVTSHNTEHLALCPRFVDAKGDIMVEFITFLSLEHITGLYIAEKIMEFLKDNDLPVENIRGQGYDGASNKPSVRICVFKYKYESVSTCNISTAVPPSMKSSYKSFMCLNRIEVRNVIDQYVCNIAAVFFWQAQREVVC